jgi:heat shock protein HspQ
LPRHPTIDIIYALRELRTEGNKCSAVRDNESMLSVMRARKSMKKAKFAIGQVVQHKVHSFRGIIFDVDPVFANTEEWWLSIPEDRRPAKNQPYYHLLAENSETEYIAYVSEQNLLPDKTGKPLRHPQVRELFRKSGGRDAYRARFLQIH